MHETSDSAVTSLIVVSIVAVVVSLVVAVVFPKIIISVVTALHEAIKGIASGKGDLTARLPDMGADELGRVSQSFNEFLATMQALVKSVFDSSVKVNQSS